MLVISEHAAISVWNCICFLEGSRLAFPPPFLSPDWSFLYLCMGFYGLQEIEFEWWLLCCTLQLPKTRNTGNILHQRKTAVFEILCSFLGCWLVRNNKRLWTSVGVITGCVWSVTHLFWCRFTRLCHIFIWRISAVRADYWCGPMGAVVFEGFSWS